MDRSNTETESIGSPEHMCIRNCSCFLPVVFTFAVEKGAFEAPSNEPDLVVPVCSPDHHEHCPKRTQAEALGDRDLCS